MISKTVTIPVDLLQDTARSALTAAGMPYADAEDVARVLVMADLFGIHTHGVQRIPQYLERVRIGGVSISAEMVVEQVAPSIVKVDGANGVGPLVGWRTLTATMEAARTTGVGIGLARHSNHFGPVMPYLYAAAEAGFASMIASNATTTIAPTGGAQAKIGNNPVGWGMPSRGSAPVLLDIALSTAARAKIRAAAREGRPIPDTWATDKNGTPTTDPSSALEGFLLPIGGHKGYGLSVMMDLFAGVLSGAAYLDKVSSWSDNPGEAQNLGHFFLLIDTSMVGEESKLLDDVEDFRRRVLATPATDPHNPVRLPGQHEVELLERQTSEGVEIASEDLAALRALGTGATSPVA
ncbi:Ldh family oxidoreductase [Pseudonocardia zijingensis]|uniref:Ldh family oxidoreductase n=1 Tax=Pseudonocardia zijingensis TaxID=153376 RepID=A0ABN1NZ15_9PSEU